MSLVLFAAIFWIAPMIVGHQVGKGKNRTGWLWGFFCGWLGVIILALVGPAKPMTLERLESQRGSMTQATYNRKHAAILAAGIFMECPFCKEQMRADATVCPHCQRDVVLAATLRAVDGGKP